MSGEIVRYRPRWPAVRLAPQQRAIRKQGRRCSLRLRDDCLPTEVDLPLRAFRADPLAGFLLQEGHLGSSLRLGHFLQALLHSVVRGLIAVGLSHVLVSSGALLRNEVRPLPASIRDDCVLVGAGELREQAPELHRRVWGLLDEGALVRPIMIHDPCGVDVRVGWTLGGTSTRTSPSSN